MLWNGKTEIETNQFGSNNSLSEYVISDDRKWTRQYWYKFNNNDERWPFAQMNFSFDGSVKGCVYFDNTVKHTQVTEELAENEIIVGFKGYLDKDTNMLRSISMKTALLPKCLASPAPLRITPEQMQNVTFSPRISRERLIATLIDAELPFSGETRQTYDFLFESDMIGFIKDSFAKGPDTEEF